MRQSFVHCLSIFVQLYVNRPRTKALIPKRAYLGDLDYIMQMLYKNCY